MGIVETQHEPTEVERLRAWVRQLERSLLADQEALSLALDAQRPAGGEDRAWPNR